jgi:hypothetical protein
LTIDARQLTSEELFTKLRDILASHRGCDVSIDILLDTRSMSERVKAFVSMTGCQTELEEKNGYYIIRIRGSPCCI